MNYRQIKAIEMKNKKRFLELNKDLNDKAGIYILTREDEDGFRFAYIGQAKHILTRLASHLRGYQHIDLSLKKHGLYHFANPHGWRVDFFNCSEDKLDEYEQEYILKYANLGYQLRNKTTGSQGKGKKKLDEYKPSKGYRDGLVQGRKNASREVAHWFDKHLNVSTKKEPPTVNQQKALDKFQDFLDFYQKGDEK